MAGLADREDTSTTDRRRGRTLIRLISFLVIPFVVQLYFLFDETLSAAEQEDKSFHFPNSEATLRIGTQNATISSLDKEHFVSETHETTQEYVGAGNFDFLNPVWPDKPPALQRGCVVKFRDDKLSVCHITPWPNFGDELGPPITRRLLELYFGCSAEGVKIFDLEKLYQGGGNSGFLNRTGSPLDTCLMTVGSLWRMVKSGDHIWGTGVATDNTVRKRCKRLRKRHPWMKVNNVTVYSSRGPLSAGQIQNHCNVTNLSGEDDSIEGAGDAGFLVPFLFPEHRQNDAKSPTPCFLPHKKDENDDTEWKKTMPNAQKLTVGMGWINMTLRMQTCSSVVSSSLHGVVFAEALGIPSKWYKRSEQVGEFKFQDFYSSLRPGQSKALAPVRDMGSALDNLLQPLGLPEREAYARRVVKTFPIHLFHAVDSD